MMHRCMISYIFMRTGSHSHLFVWRKLDPSNRLVKSSWCGPLSSTVVEYVFSGVRSRTDFCSRNKLWCGQANAWGRPVISSWCDGWILDPCPPYRLLTNTFSKGKRKANKEHKDTIGKHLWYSFTILVVHLQRFFLRSRIHPKFIQVHPKWFCLEAHLRNLLRAKDRRVVRRGPRGRRPWEEAPSMMRSWRGVVLKPEGFCETYHVWTTLVTSSLVAFAIASGKALSCAQRNARHPPSPTSPVTPSPSPI